MHCKYCKIHWSPDADFALCQQHPTEEGDRYLLHVWERDSVSAGVNPKDLVGAKKPQVGLIPVGAMASVARVMELGAKKYGPYNWRSNTIKLMVYAHAALRHLFAWIGGETTDTESGEPHLAHAAACCLIALDALSTGNAVDDREWPTDQTPKDSK
jgi:hypothetical protein